MSMNRVQLPMVDSRKSIPCCEDLEKTSTYTDAADANWITGRVETATGPVYRISTSPDRKDLFGAIKTRCSFGRMKYTIPPALYAIGAPDDTSEVLVSANYKLSFDYLRRELSSLNLWLLVLDTKGINVWCAAGKGSFGTAEVIRMINLTGLSKLISHRTLILPQLAAPGVAAHEVRRQTGFKVIYGPVRAADIPAFLKAGNLATAEMRSTSFKLSDRLILTPVELVGMIVPLIIFTTALFLLNFVAFLFNQNPILLMPLISKTLSDLFPFLIALLVGVVLVPALLPYVPGRSFAWKGWLLGLIWAIIYTLFVASEVTVPIQTTAYILVIPAITAFIGLNFTGSTTYTSLSGVLKEMGIALPLIVVSAVLGLTALITAYFI